MSGTDVITVDRETARALAANVGGGLTTEQVLVVRNTVAKDTTPEELAMFFGLATRYDLDPFAREIWCVARTNDDGSRRRSKSGDLDAPMIMVGRDGFLKIANRSPSYEGMASGVVYAGEQFELVQRTTRLDDERPPVEFEHRIDFAARAKQGAKPLLGYAIVYRSDRSVPQVEVVSWDQYGKPNISNSRSSWAKFPDAMLTKVAEAVALRKAFSVSGVISEEESFTVLNEDAEPAVTPPTPLHQPRPSLASRGIGRPRSRPAVVAEQPLGGPEDAEGTPRDPENFAEAEVVRIAEAERQRQDADAEQAQDEVPWLPPDPNEPLFTPPDEDEAAAPKGDA